jgi:hypothetical protein
MKTFWLLCALFLAAFAVSSRAATLADISVVDRTTGERLQTYVHQGRRYVVGRPGNRYAIEIYNRTPGRVMAVVAVDGVNAITGETAAASQSGYVFDAWQRSEILGWRKSMDDVAAFYFTRLADSYAARTGRPDNVGVIGVALYREYVEPWRGDLLPQPAAKSAAQGESVARGRAEAQTQQLGTGHGERLDSSIRYTDFRKASEQPVEVVTLYYDSYDNLVARGIIGGARPGRPNPFPGGFVPDPA